MRVLSLAALLCGTALAYQTSEPMPEVISPLTLVSEQNLIENPKAVLRGSVESVKWEQVGMASSENVVHSKLTRYDRDGRVVEATDRWLAESRTTSVYESGQLARTSSRRLVDGKPSGEETWQTWRYDVVGRVLETKRGQGEKLQNHLTSSYDASGRLLRVEVRQGAQDALVFTNVYRYSGNPVLIERRTLSASGRPREPLKKQLDAKGNVVELWDEDGIHVRLKYDEQNRVVEQATDAYTIPAGCDECPLPGRIQIVHLQVSPEERVREQTFFDEGGKPVLRRTLRLERDGSIASIRFETLSVAPSMLNRVIGAITPTGGDRYVETTWDEHGNWTEKRDCFRPTGGEARVQFVYRRKIVYR